MTVLDLTDPRPTLADVARAAGVSSATASWVINGFPRVRPETRRQVEDAINHLGYVRQRASRNHGKHRPGSVAVVVCEEAMRLCSDPFFGRVLWGVSQVLAPSGFQSLLLMAQSAKEAQSIVRYLRGGNVDGALLVSMHARYSMALERVTVPVACAGRPACADAGTYSFVDADNRGGAERAVRYLLESGRRRIATIAGPKDMSPGVDRLIGYQTALMAEGRFDPGLVAHGDFGQSSGEHMTRRLLDRRPDIDAIFVASDLMAAGALRALRRSGRKVPDDVAVIGFDNSPLARSTEPPLTTVNQPVESIGGQAARELLSLIAGNSAEGTQLVLETELVIRESA
ncbi:MAG TPA: LacI family DNA-binding transcriptional regulator [Pseudonocardiaceae bacterium]|nr:LacI family DNA-binding transcriptional regulator [Pseudonocardiaceae bacterium]